MCVIQLLPNVQVKRTLVSLFTITVAKISSLGLTQEYMASNTCKCASMSFGRSHVPLRDVNEMFEYTVEIAKKKN